MANLFTPYELKSLKFRNRIAVPPMCQYSAVDGLANDWHLSHYTSMARGGAGIVIVEATGVSPEGRITPKCLGLWSDQHAEALKPIVKGIKAGGAVAGIQIGHAGRKASANIPWEGDNHIPEGDPRGWQPIGPSAKPYDNKTLPRAPKEMTKEDIQRVTADFVSAAKRALEAGFEYLELHFAHGYLAQSFFSPHANLRTDEYGGGYEGRSKFLKDTFKAVRAVWPEHLPLTARFGVIEFDGRDEETMQESIRLAKDLKSLGLDFLNVSVAFNIPDAKIPWGPGFLIPFAERVRREAQVPVATAWGVDIPELANGGIEKGQIDLVMVGRAFLANPHWAYKAALDLKVEKPSWTLPAPYAHWLERYGAR